MTTPTKPARPIISSSRVRRVSAREAGLAVSKALVTSKSAAKKLSRKEKAKIAWEIMNGLRSR